MNQQTALFNQYETQPELWLDSHMITADVPLKRKQASKILPLGLRLTDTPTATFFIVDYRRPNFTAPYREAALLLHVKTLLGTGLHCCWMTVDDDTAMIYGRELLGYPKKMADISFTEGRSTISASVTRRGIEVLAMKGEKRARLSNPAPVFDRKMFNVGGLGNMTILQGIWLSRSKEFIRESHEAEVEINLADSDSDPIKNLIDSTIATQARIVVFDIIKGRYLLPVGIAGPWWYQRTSYLRVR